MCKDNIINIYIVIVITKRIGEYADSVNHKEAGVGCLLILLLLTMMMVMITLTNTSIMKPTYRYT